MPSYGKIAKSLCKATLKTAATVGTGAYVGSAAALGADRAEKFEREWDDELSHKYGRLPKSASPRGKIMRYGAGNAVLGAALHPIQFYSSRDTFWQEQGPTLAQFSREAHGELLRKRPSYECAPFKFTATPK